VSGAINFDEPSKGNVSSTDTALSVVNDGEGDGITSESKNKAGVRARSKGIEAAIVGSAAKATGVFGHGGEGGAGVLGETGEESLSVDGRHTWTGSGPGVKGVSHYTGNAVEGIAEGNGMDVFGLSHGENNAVVGIADKFAGVFGESKGEHAGFGAQQKRIPNPQ